MIQRLLHALTALAMATLLAAGLVLAPGPARAATDGLVEGRDYVVIPGGRPFKPEAGKVEVVEVFAYWCHVCHDFQPHLADWVRKAPDDVAFRYLPAAFSPDDALARAFFAADALGVRPRSHEAIYRAIHAEWTLPQRGATVDEIAGFLGRVIDGTDHAAVAAAMRAPTVDTQMAASRDFIVATGIEGTPTMVVNGRYRVIGRGFRDMLRITDLLVARERAATTSSPASAPDESKP